MEPIVTCAALKVLLVRHGHVEGIKPERFRGRQPLALTALGRAQAAAVAHRIAGTWQPSTIYTSPMGRCVETGAAIANACGTTAAICEDLNDIDYGAWQFMTFEQAHTVDPALFAAWFATPQYVRFPHGESLQDAAVRVANTLRFVRARHPHDTIVLVGHDSINRVLLLQLLDLPLSAYWRLAQEPCCINEAEIAGDKTRILRLNETQHLGSMAP